MKKPNRYATSFNRKVVHINYHLETKIDGRGVITKRVIIDSVKTRLGLQIKLDREQTLLLKKRVCESLCQDMETIRILE